MSSKSFLLALLSLSMICFASCYSTKNLAYFTDLTSDTSRHYIPIKQDSFLVKAQPDDILGIDIISRNPSLSAQLNLSNSNYMSGYNGSLTSDDAGPVSVTMNNTTANGYRVDRNGDIVLGLIGKVHVAGLTLPNIKDTLETIIKATQVKDPLVKVQLLNFRVSVMGEVGHPGIITIENRDKYSILDALNQAGDITLQGKRKNVLLLRDTIGGKIAHQFDLTNTSSFASDYFYLKQNDIVYVSPTAQKALGTTGVTDRVINYVFSSLSLISIIVALSNR